MARAWIVDLWVKDASATLPDGTVTKITPTREQMRSIKSLPEHFRTSKWLKGKRWRVAWNEATPNGPKTRAKLFASKQDAEAFKAELEDDIRMGRYIDPSARERPFAEVAEEWLTSKKVKESTWLRYRDALDDYILPQWGSMSIGAITRPQIDEWVTQLSEGTATTNFARRKAKKPLAPSYVAHLVRVSLGSVLRYAVSARIIPANPLAEVEVPQAETTDVEDLPVLVPEEIDGLANAAAEVRDDEADGLLVLFLAYCGPRINEALALQVRDIDLKRRRARIRQTWSRTKDGGWTLGPPKTWKRRTIPIPRFLIAGLAKLMQGRAPTDPLFYTSHGPIAYRQWRDHVWVKAAAAFGLVDGFTIHDLRHTAASLAIRAGADVKLVQRMLGHRDATETLNTYSHLWPDRMDEVMDAMQERRRLDLGLEEEDDGDELEDAA